MSAPLPGQRTLPRGDLGGGSRNLRGQHAQRAPGDARKRSGHEQAGGRSGGRPRVRLRVERGAGGSEAECPADCLALLGAEWSADWLGLVRGPDRRPLHTDPARLRGRQGLDSRPGGRPRGGPQLQHPRRSLAAAVPERKLGLPQLPDDGYLGIFPLRGSVIGRGQGQTRVRGLPL